eukprot:CAMPEP_0118900274 /NCGR_PEP_ID=MMETSP1166-20130328/6451_1 /TAXON_ID=1104430 /ORGANISM="Chrysoreinhardia sp, Strain CCMP3193" /LENGTH=1003 /DNA_ID=CAMNT_0006839413 /DNA_START=44 /DNA_END=3055 /DNA_ORIENTATION=-
MADDDADAGAGADAVEMTKKATTSELQVEVEKESSSSSSSSSSKEEGNLLNRLSKKVELMIAIGCARIAVAVSKRPWRTIWISVFVCALLSLGWFRIDDEQQVENLYTPQTTRAFRDRKWVEDHFKDADASSDVLLNREDGDTNLLDRAALEEVFDLYEFALTIDSERRSRGYDERSCAEVYWTSLEGREVPTETCQKAGILAFWDWNRTKFHEDTDILGTINDRAKEDCCDPSGRVVTLEDVAAKLEYDDDPGADSRRVTGAGALKLKFYLTTSLNSISRSDPHQLRLENKFDRRLRGNRYASFQQALPLTGYGLGQNADGAFDQDRLFINLAIVLIVSYAYLALWNRKAEKSRGGLGLGAVACVVLSTVAGFGVAMVSGVTFSPSTGVAIFLVLGIGLDDSFVIAGAIDEPFEDEDWYDPALSALENDAKRVIDQGESIEDAAARRIVHTLRSSGPSITVTSITDAAAFLAGSATRTPDIAAFNRFCAISVIVDFAMQLTFFVGLFTLDQRRRLRKKVGDMKDDRNKKVTTCCGGGGGGGVLKCCAAYAPEASVREADEDDDVEESENETSNKTSTTTTTGGEVVAVVAEEKHAEDKDVEEQGGKAAYVDDDHAFWTTHYPRYLLSTPGKVFVIATSIVVLALGIVGCLRFEVDIDEDWTFVDAPGKYRYARLAFDFDRDHFSTGSSRWVGLYTKHADYFANGQAMRETLDGYAQQGFVVTESLSDNWFDEHARWLAATNRTVASQLDWLASLHDFLEDDAGLGYVDKIAFDGPRGNIVGTEIDTRWKDEDVTGGINMRRMRNSREEVRDASKSRLGTVIVYNNQFVWHESFAFIAGSTFFSMIIAVSTVFLVLVVLLGDVLAATLVTAFVADVCICVFGSLYWYNDAVNYITAFFIVIAVGLSADAPAHVCHAYLEARGPTRDLRAKECLAKLGPSVFRGGVSTILGIAVTGFCVTYVFQTFFKYLMTILVLSLWNGLAVMPVVCSLFGPMPSHDIIVHA